jgi:putative hemolysin
MIITSLILILALLLLCSAFFSGAETALFSLSHMRARSFKQDSAKAKKIVGKLLENPRELLVTMLMFNVTVNILIQNVTSRIFGTFSSWLLTVGVPLILTLFLGEAIPKSVAISHNLKIAPIVAPIIYAIQYMIAPIRIVLTFVASGISRICFFFLKREKEISLDELKHALKTSKERGIISQDEAKLIRGSLKVDEMIVKELMQPRQEIISHNIEDPPSNLVQIFVDKECSQVPIIDKEIDTVIGIMTADRYFLHRKKIVTGNDLKRFIKTPIFVPEIVSVRNLLATFQELQETIALVVDEYGLISGIVTKEDIFEMIIGQIEDKRSEKSLYTRQSNDVIIASGKMELHDLEEIFDIHLESSSNMVTIGGWLTEMMGEIPKNGAKYTTEQLLFHILSSTPTRVSRVYIRKLKGGKRDRS